MFTGVFLSYKFKKLHTLSFWKPGKKINKEKVMKKNQISLLAVLLFIGVLIACKKQYSGGEHIYPVERKVRFQLWTNEDFSDDNSLINFSVFIKSGRKKLYDSSLVSMHIKDIPDSLHRIILEKTVTADINAILSAGFTIEIQGVGTTRRLDTAGAGNRLKVVNYAFR